MGARTRSSGFTLLEVVVALAVIALALGAAIKATGDAAGASSYLRDKTLAHWVAMNRLTELRVTDAWPDTGTSEGQAQMAGRDWHWEQTVEETSESELRRVELRVGAGEEADRDDSALALLVGFVGEPSRQR